MCSCQDVNCNGDMTDPLNQCQCLCTTLNWGDYRNTDYTYTCQSVICDGGAKPNPLDCLCGMLISSTTHRFFI